jgi:ankyrin repeat protein
MTLLDRITAGDEAGALAALDADPAQAGAADEAGVSALLLARYRGMHRLVDAIAARRDLTLPEAAAAGDLARVGALLAGGADVDERSADGFAAVQLALFFGNVPAAALLVRAGADVRAPAGHAMGIAAIHAAAAGPAGVAAVALAVAAGADLDATQQGGFTALHEAAHRGDVVMADLPLAAGADPGVVTDDGATPADLARRDGHAELADRLAGAGAGGAAGDPGR